MVMESVELKGIDEEDEAKVEGCEEEWFEKRIEEIRSEVEETKRKRMEDMKANEKVLAIFASKEEAWKREKRKLMQELDALREIEKYNSISSHEKNGENLTQACSNQDKNEEYSKDHHESSAESKSSNPTMDEMVLKHAKEVHQRKLAYGKYVAVISELKGQKEKAENMLRNTLVEMGTWKRDAVLKAKEKKLVDAALRKVTDEIIRLQKEMDDKDRAIAQMKQKELGGNRVLDAELRAKELELSNAKMLLQQYSHGERNREREVEKWKRLYLGIKLELDNMRLQMVGRQSSGLLSENEHNSKGETQSSSFVSRNTKRGEAEDLLKKQLLQEIEAQNEQLQGLRRQLTNMEKEMEKDKKLEFLSRSLNNDKEDKVEAQKEGMSIKQMFFLARSNSCNSDSKISSRQKARKNHDSKTAL